MTAERIEVSLGRFGTKVFDSVQELETWFNEERGFWSWLELQQPWSEAKQAIWQRYIQFLGNIPRLINEAKTIKQNAESTKQTPQFQSCYSNIQSYFKSCYEQQNGVPSTTPLGKHIALLRKSEGDPTAAGALAYCMRCPMNLNHFDNFKGAMMGFAFEAGINDRNKVEAQTLEAMRIEWEKKFQTFRDGLQTETETHKRLNSDCQQLLSKQDSTFNTMLSAKDKDLNGILTAKDKELKDLVASSKNEWNNLRKTYDDELAVRAPVLYWRVKAKTHFWMAWAFAITSIVAAGLFLWVLIDEIIAMMKMPAGVQDPEKWHPEYWRMAVVVASGLFGVWVIRILVRLLLSNIHLQTDARERVTMVQTYLALARRGKFKDEERLYILQSLFRPTPTGIVRDDAVPLTVVESITKLGK